MDDDLLRGQQVLKRKAILCSVLGGIVGQRLCVLTIPALQREERQAREDGALSN